MTEEQMKEMKKHIDDSVYNCGVAIIQSLSDFIIRYVTNLFAKKEKYQHHIDSPLKYYDEILKEWLKNDIKGSL